MPVSDGAILPADCDSQTLAPVPLIVGFTRNESRYFIKPGMLSYSRLLLFVLTKVLAGKQARAVRSKLAKHPGTIYDRFDRIYTAAVFAEPTFALAKRLQASSHRFYGYRFDKVSPSARSSNLRAQHTAELRYLFGTLPTAGYDAKDQQISNWMQAQWTRFARDGYPVDGAHWRAYDDREQFLLIDDSFDHARLDDDPVVPLLHQLRQIDHVAPKGMLSRLRGLLHKA